MMSHEHVSNRLLKINDAEIRCTLHVEEGQPGKGYIRDTMGQNCARQRGNNLWGKHSLLDVRVQVRQ